MKGRVGGISGWQGKTLGLLAAGVLRNVMKQPEAARAVGQGWAPGSVVMAVRITS